MSADRILLIAGDPSGDQLGAELVDALHRTRPPGRPAPEVFAAGGPRLAAGGTEQVVDLTRHSVIGLWEVIRKYAEFRRIFHDLLDLATERRPDLVVGIDYGGFNLRFARALYHRAAATRTTDAAWTPRLVQFVSPQLWASRPGRARILEAHHDLVLSILPFEVEWYTRHAPGVRVEFVGHPLVDRHARQPTPSRPGPDAPQRITLLPGSRTGELRRHLPVILGAAARIHRARPDTRFVLVAPDASTAASLSPQVDPGLPVEIRAGRLGETLADSTLAIASTGTVTLECAWYGIPTLCLYRTSWVTYQIGRRIIQVPHLAMPNLLAGGTVFPEFIQDAATPEALADAALRWLDDPKAADAVRDRLRDIVARLGPPGACDRAAHRLWNLLETGSPRHRLAPRPSP